MKRAYIVWIGALIAGLVLAVFSFGKISAASTGCFTDTNGHWAETFICWLKDNGISSGYTDGSYHPDNPITRAEMAVMLKRSAQVPPEQGEVQVVMGHEDWAISNSEADFKKFSHLSYTGFQRFSTPGYGYILAIPTLPTALYGKKLSLSGYEICFSELSLNSQVTNILVDYYVQTSDGGQTFTVLTDDNTLRYAKGCVTYNFTPRELGKDTFIGFYITMYFHNTADAVRMGRTTLFLQPTTTAVTP